MSKDNNFENNLKKACEEKLKSIESQIKKIKQENNKVTKEDFK